LAKNSVYYAVDEYYARLVSFRIVSEHSLPKVKGKKS